MGVERTRAAFHREELTWAAGLWDGEGCCGCYGRYDGGKKKRKASYWHIRINISQHDREVLDRFAAAVGVGKVYGPYRGTVWHFQCVGKNAEIVIGAIWPWLSNPKRRQIEAARAKFAARGEPAKGGHACEPDCTCGRQKWKTDTDVDPKLARRREQQRDATRRYRFKLKESA